MHEILGDYELFVGDLNKSLELVGIARDELAMLDHLCYRVETLQRYRELKELFATHTLFLGAAQINGRQISTFEFSQPLCAGGWHIPYLELPAPKEGSSYKEGLEHAEFVVIGGLRRFQARHPDLTFNEEGMTKKINPELGLKTDGMSVKFHEQPLGAVVRIEERLGINRSSG